MTLRDFGFLGDDPRQRTFALPDLGPTSMSWGTFFHGDRVARHYLDQGYLDPDEAEILASLPARLGDIQRNGNLLVAPGSRRIYAILDYTESMAGDPRWELAWIRYYFANDLWDRPAFNLVRFWAGYGAEYGSDDPLGRFYLAVILHREKLCFYDPA